MQYEMVSVPLFGGGTENKTVTFDPAEKRENIKSGEKHKTIFGKIARYFADLKLVAFTGSYDDLNGKPSSFPPSSHKHGKADITDFPSSLPASDVAAWAKASNKPSYNWSEIGGKPSAFTPAAHTHDDSYVKLYSSLIKGQTLDSYLTFNRGLRVGHGNYGSFGDGFELFANTPPEKEFSVTEPETYCLRLNYCMPDSSYPHARASIKSWATYKYDTALEIDAPTGDETRGAVYGHSGNKGIDNYRHFANLGKTGYPWEQVYARNSVISTSDREVKKEISYTGDKEKEYTSTYMDDAQLISLILGLKACVYKFKENDSNRPHHGLIAQDVEELLQKLGIKDHAAFIKSPKTRDVEVEEEYTDKDGSKKTRKRTVQEEIPGEYIYGLRYEEFISDIIRFCQILYNRNAELETALEEQKEKTENLGKRIGTLENIINQRA